MKYFSALVLFLTLLNSCKKDEKIVENNSSIDSIQNNSKKDSLANEGANLKIEALNIVPEKGKTVFKNNDKFLFYFDTRSNIGEIKINDKIHKLDLLNFTDNEYFISGDKVKISAVNGIFQEMTGDCLYGNFAEVKVEFDGKESVLKNISVQDCPAY